MRALMQHEIDLVDGGAVPLVAALLIHAAVRYALPRVAVAAGEAFITGVATGAVVESLE